METNNRLKEIVERLREMRLPAMADELLSLLSNNEIFNISTIDLLDRLSSAELSSRKNNTINRLIKKAHLSQSKARLEDIHYLPERNINKNVIEQLSSNDYIINHNNVIILGACGTGKSYISNALGVNACNASYSVMYTRMFEIIDDINNYEHDSLILIKKYSKPDVLIVDDFLLYPIKSKDSEILFKILEYRYNTKSTIISSQQEIEDWHKCLGSNLLADSILDRIVPRSYKIILSGDSLRNKNN